MNQLPLLRMQVQRQLRRSFTTASVYFAKSFVYPQVNYHLRGRKAGVAYLQQNEIRLNPVLLLENGNEFIRQVVPHELAHLLVYQQFGRVQPHGKEWQFVMEEVLNVPATIYHSFDIRNTGGQVFNYICGCRVHQLSIRRHNAVVRQVRQYQCRKCGQVLSFVAEQDDC